MRTLLMDAAQRAADYLEQLPTRSVAPAQDAVRRLAELDLPIPEQPGDPARTLELIDRLASPATMATAGPRFFGFVIGGSLPAPLAANWLASAWDQNSVFFEVTPGTAMLEQVALRWLVEILGLPSSTGAGFVTGATLANFTALAAARHGVLERVGWDAERDGLFGAPAVTVIVGEEAHPTLLKSLGMLGFGRSRVVKVPVDEQGRMRAQALPKISGPTILCAQAGNINTGAFDPFEPLIEAAHAAGAWVHIDGAFGLWAQASQALQPLARGLNGADSWATDAHKWLNVPYDSGIAFVRQPEILRAAMAVSAEYLPPQGEHRNPGDFTPELSRRARGTEIWAALHSLGRSGVAALIERNCAQARKFAAGLQAAGFRILNEVVLNQVLVSFGTPERTREVIAAVQADGTCWCGPTQWQGHTAMRISVSNWSTTDEDVESSLQAIVRAARASS